MKRNSTSQATLTAASVVKTKLIRAWDDSTENALTSVKYTDTSGTRLPVNGSFWMSHLLPARMQPSPTPLTGAAIDTLLSQLAALDIASYRWTTDDASAPHRVALASQNVAQAFPDHPHLVDGNGFVWVIELLPITLAAMKRLLASATTNRVNFLSQSSRHTLPPTYTRGVIVLTHTPTRAPLNPYVFFDPYTNNLNMSFLNTTRPDALNADNTSVSYSVYPGGGVVLYKHEFYGGGRPPGGRRVPSPPRYRKVRHRPHRLRRILLPECQFSRDRCHWQLPVRQGRVPAYKRLQRATGTRGPLGRRGRGYQPGCRATRSSRSTTASTRPSRWSPARTPTRAHCRSTPTACGT